VLKLQKYSKEKYSITLPITSLYGAPCGTVWNGGRPPFYRATIIDENVVEYYNSVHSDCYLTYSNHLAGNYLEDYIGNLSLEALEYSSNTGGVIITDDRLLDHVLKSFPTLKTKSSIVKVTKDRPKVRDYKYYNSLLDRYDYIVLHPDDNKDTAILEGIKDISRVEVLIDERCTEKCTVRDIHYDINAQHNLPIEDRISDLESVEAKLWSTQCPRVKSINMIKGKEKYDVLINTVEEIQHLYNLGIRKFKTSGRGSVYNESFAIRRFLDVAVGDEKARNTLWYFL
jgi:hypothetical protein